MALINEIYIDAGMSQAAIQSELTNAAPGSIVHFADGTYVLTSTLVISQGLTITGETKTGVIFDASGLLSGDYAIDVTASHVTLENFTLNGGGSNGADRGIKVAPGTANPNDAITDLLIEDVDVNSFRRAEIDLNGVDDSAITRVTINGTDVDNPLVNTAGAGIALTDSNNITLTDVTTVNNGWGGVGIYTKGQYYTGGSDGIVFDGTFSSTGEAQPIYTETEPGYGGPHPVTGMVLPDGYDFAVYNEDFRPNGGTFLTYFDSEADALAYALAIQELNPMTSADNNTSSVIYRNAGDDGQAFALGDIIVRPGMSIQAAIDAAAPGATVWVAAGTYTENLLISQSVTLLALDGPGSTIINGTSTGGSNGTIKIADGADNVQIGDNAGHGFTINGFDNPTTPAQETAAVYLLSTNALGQLGIDGFELRGNIVNANGDAALLSNWEAEITNAVIDGNTFGGKTFAGTNPASGDQFSVLNVARQLVIFGQGSTPASNKANNIDFTNNTITGTAGNATLGDHLVTIDAKNSLISGNTFEGYTAYGRYDLRARGENTEISNNTVNHSVTQSQSNGFAVTNNTTGPFTGNTLIGDGLADALVGTPGDDTFVSSLGDDIFVGGLGSDTVDYSATTEGVTVNDAEAYSTGFTDEIGYDTLSGIENVIGGSGDDEFFSTATGVANTFVGGAGNDTFSAGTGTDTFVYETAMATDGMATQFNAVRIVVNGGAEGTDDLRNVEQILFRNGTASAADDILIDVKSGNAVVYSQDDTASTTEDAVSATGNVLTNDINLDENALVGPGADQKVVVSFGAGASASGTAPGGTVNGTHGTLTLGSNGTWTYTPNTVALQTLAVGETAVDTFSYTAGDGTADTDTATLIITIDGTNDAPVFGFSQNFDVNAAGIVSGDGFGAVALATSLASAGGSIVAEDNSQFAVLTGTPAGAFTRLGGYRTEFTDGATAEVEVYLDTAWGVGQGFEYSVASTRQTNAHLRDFVLSVSKDDDGRLLVQADNNSTGNGSIPDLSSQPGVTEVENSGWYTIRHTFTENELGDLAVMMQLVNSAGVVIYTTTRTTTTDDIVDDVGGNRYGWFTGINVAGGLAVDGISLQGVNAGAVAELPEAGPELMILIVPPSELQVGGNLLFDDIDSTDDGHEVSVVETDRVGTLVAAIIEDATGANLGGTIQWIYTVDNSAVDYLAQGETLVETFTVLLTDGEGGSATETVTITVTGSNDTPVLAAVMEPLVIDEDESVFATQTQVQALIAEYVDDVDLADSHDLIVTISDGMTEIFTYDSGVTVDFDFDPPANFNGTLSVTIVARDSAGALSNQQTYNLEVTPVIDLTGNDSTDEGDEDGGVITGNLNDFNDTTSGEDDPVAGVLSYALVEGQGPQNGLLTLDEVTGAYSYTPNENFNGVDTFTYLVTDAAPARPAKVPMRESVANSAAAMKPIPTSSSRGSSRRRANVSLPAPTTAETSSGAPIARPLARNVAYVLRLTKLAVATPR